MLSNRDTKPHAGCMNDSVVAKYILSADNYSLVCYHIDNCIGLIQQWIMTATDKSHALVSSL